MTGNHVPELRERPHDLDIHQNGPGSLFRMPDSMATPCSVKAKGIFLIPPQLDVTICDFKFSNSALFSWNMKSSGNRLVFLLTA